MLTDEINILLPPAHIDVFVTNEKTCEAVALLQKDWRFARVSFEQHNRDIKYALDYYQESQQAHLVVVETSSIDKGFTKQLDELSNLCPEGSAAIVIGPDNDINLYRQLITMGVSDYLVNPVPVNVLSDVIGKTLIEAMGTKDSTLLSFIGAKGGVGTSTLSHLSARILSEDFQQKVILLDFAQGWSTLGAAFEFEPAGTLSEAINHAVNQDKESLERMLHVVHDKLFVLSVGAEGLFDNTIEPALYERFINFLMVSYPFVLVDLSGAPRAVQKIIINRSHHNFCISTPSVFTLRAARSLLQSIIKLNGGNDHSVDFVLNKMDEDKSTQVNKSEIEKAIDHPIAEQISYDPKLFLGAESQGTIPKNMKDTAGNIQKIRKILERYNIDKMSTKAEGNNILNSIVQRISGQ